MFGFLDGPSLVAASSVTNRWYHIVQERELWIRLCTQGTYMFSNMDHLIINYIPGIWGRIFHAHTTRTWTELTKLVEHNHIDLHTLYIRLWAAQQNKCGVCFKQASTWHLNHLLIKICSACCKDKSKFITKTEAKRNFFLHSDEEFDNAFCLISHNRRYYLEEDIKKQALCKYGSEDGFKHRRRQFSERSQKIKLGKEMKQVRRKRLSGKELGDIGVAKDPLKGTSLSDERVKLALMFLGFVQRSPTAVRDLVQWFNVSANSPLMSLT